MVIAAGIAGSGPLRVGACLSLSDRYARFGSQAAWALQVWAALDGDAEVVIEDDRSDPGTLQALLPKVAAACDVLLGPYSTQLARAAGKMAAAAGWLVWNHGGSGDDVQAACPGHVVSLLTPASRYAERFIRDVRRRHRSWSCGSCRGRARSAGRSPMARRRSPNRPVPARGGWATVMHGRARRGPGRWCPRARSRTTCRRSIAPGACQTRPG